MYIYKCYNVISYLLPLISSSLFFDVSCKFELPYGITFFSLNILFYSVDLLQKIFSAFNFHLSKSFFNLPSFMKDIFIEDRILICRIFFLFTHSEHMFFNNKLSHQYCFFVCKWNVSFFSDCFYEFHLILAVQNFNYDFLKYGLLYPVFAEILGYVSYYFFVNLENHSHNLV